MCLDFMVSQLTQAQHCWATAVGDYVCCFQIFYNYGEVDPTKDIDELSEADHIFCFAWSKACTLTLQGPSEGKKTTQHFY